MSTGGLRRGEKVLFGITGLFILFSALSFVGMEVYRHRSGKVMYAVNSHFDFSPEGLKGSLLFRDRGCTECHRAVRNGTNNGVNLDGLGSRRTLAYIKGFLSDPEATYQSRTMEHGPDKAAAYVARLPQPERDSIAVFLSELRATQGSPDARLPGSERSGFIDDMVKVWAPSSWKQQYRDVRSEAGQTPQGAAPQSQAPAAPAPGGEK